MSALLTRLGYSTFELFSFTAIGIPVWLISVCYLLILAVVCPIAAIKATTTGRS